MMLKHSLTDRAAWKFRDASKARWLDAVVPGCVHRDLLRHGLISDPFWGRNEHDVQGVSDRVWEYRTEFAASAELLAQGNIDLVAEELDTLASVFLNGHLVSRTDNMFTGVRVAVRRYLRMGKNRVLVRFESATRYVASERQDHRPREINDPVGGCTRIRKEQRQFGWDWGPRLVTAGIGRDLRLEAWSRNRLVDVRVKQKHSSNGVVTLEFVPEVARVDDEVHYKGTVSLAGKVVAQITDLEVKIPEPQLWWPSGQGEQPLYEVQLELWAGDQKLDSWSRRIGLRTIELEQKRDRWGESFQFLINGRPVFAKGASWIPAHCFVAGLTRADYEPLLRSVRAANMNMVRIWGGGVYEQECFYDLCDELGLLVWQDFMFACTLYPGDKSFLISVRNEAEYQVKRLRNRACLALWCGNNELELLNGTDLAKPRQRKAYDAIFRQILPEAVARHDAVTTYWRSSPSQNPARGLNDPERSGNAHFWDVWHLLRPVKSYELKVFRFVGEFGMQSFPSPEVAATFCPPDQRNVFSLVMENHQKNPMGNRIILEYITRRYRYPKNYAALSYLSQLNQAYCMQIGVEHYRRNQPRCMGTLYWQINDCWPGASWSSLEFGGRWKALHHAARRFYAPLLVSAHVPGDETVGIVNRLGSTVREVHLHTVCDLPGGARGKLQWELWNTAGSVCLQGQKRVILHYGESLRQKSLDLAVPLKKFGREKLYLRIALEVGGDWVSEETVFLCPPRFIDLQRGKTGIEFRQCTPREWEISLMSPVFQHRFMFELQGLTMVHASDNWFDLYPGRVKRVKVNFSQPVDEATLRTAFRQQSLVDSYE